MTVTKIISGGQVGADIAGLRAAYKAGIETGGWISHGFRTLAGSRPELGEVYGLKETTNAAYPERTGYNVRDSDATIRFARNWNSPGEKATLREIKKYKRPYFDVFIRETAMNQWSMTPEWQSARYWLIDHEIKTLNVAGNALFRIEQVVEDYLLQVLTNITNEAGVKE